MIRQFLSPITFSLTPFVNYNANDYSTVHHVPLLGKTGLSTTGHASRPYNTVSRHGAGRVFYRPIRLLESSSHET